MSTVPLVLTTAPIAPMDAIIGGLAIAANQLLSVGSKLYYLTRNQVASGVGVAGRIEIYKSIDIVTWNLAAFWDPSTVDPPNHQAANSFDCGAIVVGTTIYIADVATTIVGFPPVFNVYFHVFDTLTDTFSANSALGPQVGSAASGSSLSVLNDGRLVFTKDVNTLFGPIDAPKYILAIYDPGFNTWAAPVTIHSDLSKTVKQIHDAASDLTFIFYYLDAGTPAPAGNTDCKCITYDAGLNAFTDTLIFSRAAGLANSQTGIPTLCNGEIILPFSVGSPFPPPLMSARSPIQALPVWTIDTVEDYSLLPAGSVVTQYDQSIPGGWSAQCIGGLLYSFYAVDNGELDDPTSQSFLYYRSFSAGAWATPLVLFTSVVPGEMLAPFGASIGGAPVILVGIIDPTTYPAYASLTHFILFGSPGSTLTISGTPPSGQVGIAYGFCFTVTGGTPPYTFSTPGPLPPGLSLSPSTGCITGTPLASPSSVGTWCFTVTVVDSTLTSATTSPCITIFATILIQLIGWKLYPESPCGPLSQAPCEPVTPLLVPRPGPPVEIVAPGGDALAPAAVPGPPSIKRAV